jgi:hypothetical protein
VTETLVLIDGFDDYSVAADAVAGGWAGNTGAAAAGNIAGNCLTGTGNAISHVYGADAYVHHLFYWKTSAAGSAISNLWRALEGATEHLRLAYNGNGTFTFSRAGTTVGTTPTSANLGIISNSWYHIEIIARVHDTAGSYDVYVNGVLACTGGGSALDTRNGGTAGTPDAIAFIGNSQFWDDVIVYVGSGGAQKGMARVITKLPTGDGANTSWNPSTGSRYTCVDEAAPNSTDYISSATPGDRNTFTYPALGVTGTVLGVAPTSLATKDDAGTRTIRETIRTGGNDYDGAVDKTLTTTYVDYQEVWEANPSGGAWTVSGVDAAEFGVKLTA